MASFLRLLQIGVVLRGGGILAILLLGTSCQTSSWVFWKKPQAPYGDTWAQGSSPQGATTNMYGGPRGQRLQPDGTAVSPPAPPGISYAYGQPSQSQNYAAPAASAASSSYYTPVSYDSPNRWATAHSWTKRPPKANWRGSGVGWKRGQRQRPGHFSHKTKAAEAPSVASSSWQTAPYYSQTPQAQQSASPSTYASQPFVPPPYDAQQAPSYAYGGGGVPEIAGGASSQAAPSYSSSSYVIRKGDTLSGIARQHQVSLSALLQANGMTLDQVIHPGQSIVIPR